ncbi:MAG: cytochrome c [Granulosicoccaceae bacterium]
MFKTKTRQFYALPFILITCCINFTAHADSAGVAANNQKGAGENAPTDEPIYVEEDGMVGKGTYNGYRRFHGTCNACHGQDAMGSSFAPALVELLKDLDYKTFRKTVLEGRTVTLASGSSSAMPSFPMTPISQNISMIFTSS